MQRPVSIMISPSIVIEASSAHKVGERSSCSAILDASMVGELHGCGLAVLHQIYSVSFLVRYCGNNEKFSLYVSSY